MTTRSDSRPISPDLAALLVAVRQRSGSSQASIARRAGCDRSLVSLVEHANRHVTPELFSAYLHLTREDTTMRRRLVLTAAAAGLTGAFIPDDALADAVGGVLRPDIDAWDARLAALGEDNMRFGSAIMRPQIRTALAGLLSTPHTGKLTGHTAKALMLYARTEPTPTEAATGYRNAVALAQDTADPTTIAWVCGRAALAAGGEADTAHLTASFAERAIATGRTSNQLSSIGHYLAHAALARGWANLGDWDRTLEYCDAAMRAYEHVDPDADGSEYTYSAWRHALTISYPLSLIGHPDAQQWSDEAYGLGASGRFDTHLRLHEAIRRWRGGDPAAVEAARQTMASATGDQTTLILRTMAAQAGADEYLAAA